MLPQSLIKDRDYADYADDEYSENAAAVVRFDGVNLSLITGRLQLLNITFEPITNFVEESLGNVCHVSFFAIKKFIVFYSETRWLACEGCDV
jgi:hypothetical protein